MEGAGLVIAHPVHVAALNLAEQLGLRRAVASVFPGMIPSAYTVPGGSPVGPWRGPIGRTLNRLSWGTAMLGTRALFDRPVNAHRRQLGLAPLRAALLRLPLAADAVLVMAPPAVVVVPPDCPAHVTMTSFIGWDDVGGAELDAATEAFLEGADPPVLVTLGASSATQPDDFFVRAVSAVTAAGGRALVAAGPAYARLEGIDDDRVRVVPFVPFSQAASRCQAAIHHGGIGTTVAIARAGIPQIIVPKGFDQPDTAARFAALGVAAVVPWRSRHRLRAVVPSALADEQLRANAVRLSEAIGADGAPETADVVEALLP
jgi:UDP:flavonoid glycosyltransferase YjiC (YdhE family)